MKKNIFVCIHILKNKTKEAIMSTHTVSKFSQSMPSVLDDFFKPWNEWFNVGLKERSMSMPAVNITEKNDQYQVSLAAPGLKKEDFKIDLNGTVLTISSEKEESTENNDEKYNRKEYNYSSFSRSFSLPEEINKEKIEAKYEDGVLKISLPRKDVKIETAKQISVN